VIVCCYLERRNRWTRSLFPLTSPWRELKNLFGFVPEEDSAHSSGIITETIGRTIISAFFMIGYIDKSQEALFWKSAPVAITERVAKRWDALVSLDEHLSSRAVAV
jgi:hypothetical protein